MNISIYTFKEITQDRMFNQSVQNMLYVKFTPYKFFYILRSNLFIMKELFWDKRKYICL